MTSEETVTIDSVRNWDDARILLRNWRDENVRMNRDILDLWEKYVCSSINKFGDEKWLVYEQVYLAALDCHNYSIAEDCMVALRAQFPKSIRVRKLIGLRYEAIENYEMAMSIYQQILEEEETNALVRKRFISCLKSQNQIKEYINQLNEYVKLFQADHETWLELSDVYLNEMDFAKAAFCLEELILMNPHNHVYHQRYADIKYTQGNYEVAKNYYAYSLKLNPNNIRSLYGILLTTANLKSSQKSKESTDNSKLNNWAREQLELRYKEKKNDRNTTESLTNMLQQMTISKNETK